MKTAVTNVDIVSSNSKLCLVIISIIKLTKLGVAQEEAANYLLGCGISREGVAINSRVRA